MIRAALLLGLLANPALAQDTLTSDALLAALQTECSGLVADPNAALAALPQSPDVVALQSDDKALIQVTRSLPFGEGAIVTLFLSHNAYTGGTQSTCTLTANVYPGDPGQALLPDLADKIAAAADAVLGGPATAYGGPVQVQGASAQLRSWTAGDSFPPSAQLQFLQGPNFISLSILRLTPASGN